MGRDFDSITRSANFNIVCDETEAGAQEKIRAVESRMQQYVSEDRAAEQAKLYKYASGTPDQVISYLKEWEALGLAYAIIYFPDPAYDLSSLELFAREVMPAFAG
jgi:alkanesulfonate monooxygenase SsuD/methylene tetrahydromethanopterin reductase-like flavin-dependent oxidoreductase (luciferase family)